MEKLTPQQYCERTGKNYKMVQRYLQQIERLKQFDSEPAITLLAVRMNWLVGVESVEKFGRIYILTMKA